MILTFKLVCKVCGETLQEGENPKDHVLSHDLANYFDVVPSLIDEVEETGEQENESEEVVTEDVEIEAEEEKTGDK